MNTNDASKQPGPRPAALKPTILDLDKPAQDDHTITKDGVAYPFIRLTTLSMDPRRRFRLNAIGDRLTEIGEADEPTEAQLDEYDELAVEQVELLFPTMPKEVAAGFTSYERGRIVDRWYEICVADPLAGAIVEQELKKRLDGEK